MQNKNMAEQLVKFNPSNVPDQYRVVEMPIKPFDQEPEEQAVPISPLSTARS